MIRLVEPIVFGSIVPKRIIQNSYLLSSDIPGFAIPDTSILWTMPTTGWCTRG